ncbi:MAG: prepilin-type N-terminal cleavage/methylation domain-containing protein [Candidatus Vogelbacteria bacterium]|nr:prepilin-type N-terminal cleavage/methylation domain-containing protein [Candidatus Vogelbacteria bacterium]
MQSEKQKIIEGFTLIESLVAITVLLIGVLGPMTAATRGITDGLYAGNQLIGTYLAQEGLELLSTRLEEGMTSFGPPPAGFLDGLGDCLGNDCAVVFESYTAPNLSGFSFLSCVVPNEGRCTLAFDSSTGFYRPLADCSGCNLVGPMFIRTLRVLELVTGEEVLLTSTVKWKNKATDVTDKSINLYRYAFNKIPE